MLAERRKSSAMRIFSGVLLTGLLAAASVAAADPPAVSQSALEKGLNAYQAGQQEAAIPALAEAAEKGESSGRLFAEFYLARIYAENVGAAADHAKAYMLYRKIAEENLNVDPERSRRAPFVAKALIALAGYLRTGIKEIDLAPTPRRRLSQSRRHLLRRQGRPVRAGQDLSERRGERR